VKVVDALASWRLILMACPNHLKGYHWFVLRMKGLVCRRCGAVQTNTWSNRNLHLTYTLPGHKKL